MDNNNLLEFVFENTLYINLDERVDRLQHLQAEFAKIGIKRANRVRAIRNERGALGCTLSHIRCLEIAMKEGWDTVFICEDDITFTNPAVFLRSLREFVELAVQWDVLIIGGNLCPPYVQTHPCCARIMNCQTTTGYIVKKHYMEILLNNFRDSAKDMMFGSNIAIDIGWKRLQPTDNWYMILPATVTQYANYSDIERRNVNYTWLMLDTEKKWYIDAAAAAAEKKQNIRTGK
jgi:glycosyl transferase family 25